MKILMLILSVVFAFGNVYILDSDVNLQRYKELKLDIDDFHTRENYLKKLYKNIQKK